MEIFNPFLIRFLLLDYQFRMDLGFWDLAYKLDAIIFAVKIGQGGSVRLLIIWF